MPLRPSTRNASSSRLLPHNANDQIPNWFPSQQNSIPATTDRRNRFAHENFFKFRGRNSGAAMASASKYREYAEECRRIAQQLAPAQRAILLEIAAAWMRCAEDEERKNNKERGNGGRSSDN
jgi:hypothetical protein